MSVVKFSFAGLVAILGLVSLVSLGFAHGNVTPQTVDVTGLDKLGDKWLEANPYSAKKTPKQIKRVVEIGCSAYNANCARCHGLGVISGGTAPDLRYLEKDDEGDAWFINRIRKGYHQNGLTKMPAFEGLMAQEAMWSIRAYINIRPEDDDEAVVKGTGGNCLTLDYDRMLKVSK